MLCNRIKQFREYNGLSIEHLSDALGIDAKTYKDFESGKSNPTVDVIEKLCLLYKVTASEFYGYTPKLTLYDKAMDFEQDDVDIKILKMTDLSWEEAQLILYFRSIKEKDDLISEIIKRNFEENQE